MAWCGVALFLAVSFLPPCLLMAAWLARAALDLQTAFRALLPSARVMLLLWNSLLLAGASALVATVLGTGLAIWIHEGVGCWPRWMRKAYLIPLLIPPYVHALVWIAVSGRRQALEQLLAMVAGPGRVQVPSYGFWPAVFVMSLSLSPIVTTLVIAGLEAVEPELMEQASLMAPSWRSTRRVLLPLLSPWIVAGGGLAFVLTMVEYGVPSLLQFNTFVMEVYASFSQSNDPVHAFGCSMPLAVSATAVLVWSQSLLRNNRMRGAARRQWRSEMHSWPMPAKLVVFAAVVSAALAMVGPVVVLIFRMGSPGALWPSLAMAQGDARRSLLTASVAATVSVLVALPAALAVVRARTGGIPPLWTVCALPLAIPSPLTGIALVYLGNQPWLDWAQLTSLPLVWAHMARLLPFALFAASTEMRRIDQQLWDALSLHRVNPVDALWRVRLPLLAPALWTSWVVVFVLSLGELGATLLVSPPGRGTLPLRIYNLMHYGASDTVAALSLAVLGLGLGVATLILTLARRLWPWSL